MPVLCQKYIALPFGLPLNNQPRLNLFSKQQKGRAPSPSAYPAHPSAHHPRPLTHGSLLNGYPKNDVLHTLLADSGHIFLTSPQLDGTLC